MDLWIATGNDKKRVELCRLLEPIGYRLRLQTELAGFVPPAEDQPDFAGNAALKAKALATVARGLALADDSGLCVDALGGRPGVLSARFAGPGASGAELVAKLLHELRHVPDPDRGAAFVCAICLANTDGRILANFEGRCHGTIATVARGAFGFGYDPVFIPLAERDGGLGRTFAELTATEKDGLSHRGAALRQLAEYLQQHPGLS